MKDRPYLMLLIFALLLSACSPQSSIQETTIESYTENTMPSITEATETVSVTTPLHSQLFLPAYTPEQIQRYFEEVVLAVEYSHGSGNASLVQKWTAPIGYRIYGTPTKEDLAVLNSLFAQLNQIPGFPGFYTAEAEGLEKLRISFLEPEIFRDSFSALLDGEEATGATEFWYDADTNEIHSARIGYRTDVDQSIRNSVLIEEIINTLGITDTVQREDSITYQYSDANTSLSDVDWILLNLLYHPEIRCGMDAEQCAEVLPRLYH